jgi:hypothetical protein
MLSRATASVARQAAHVSRILSVAVPTSASVSIEALVDVPARAYSRGAWSANKRKEDSIKSAAARALKADRDLRFFKKRLEDRRSSADPVSPIGRTHAFDFTGLAATKPFHHGADRYFKHLAEAVKKTPLTMRETTLVLVQARKFPKFTRFAFEQFQIALDNPAMYIEKSMFEAAKALAENGYKYHMWTQLHTAQTRLFPDAKINWLGEKVLDTVTGTFTLGKMADLLAHEDTHEDVIAMAARKRAESVRDLLPKTYLELSTAHFKLGQHDKAVQELWNFWKLLGFTDGTVPEPFAPVRVVFNQAWHATRGDVTVNIDQLISLSNACEHAGQFSAALTNLSFLRNFVRRYDHVAVREVTPAGVTRDFMDLSTLTPEHASTVVRINLTEMRIRRAMGAAMDALPADKRPVTLLPPGSARVGSPTLSAAPADLVILTDRLFHLGSAPRTNADALRNLFRSGGGLLTRTTMNARVRGQSKWSSNPGADIALKAAAEEEACANGKKVTVQCPERTVIVVKEELTNAFDRASANIKARVPLR